MSTDDATHWQTISELARAIRAGRMTPVDVMEAVLDRIEAVNPALNAFRPLDRAKAVAEAEAATFALRAGDDRGPLHGIPFAAKDIIDVQGWVTTAGSNALLDNVATTDATVVAKLRRAGMVLAAKTQTVQFAMGAPGINHDHGTPHNPWSSRHHVPGGSSSGSGVAVAAGMVPMALGTDTGGSVRIPAALCGTVGLKTTVGQVSRAGVFPLSSTLDSVGPLTRSVEDAALSYHALHGADTRDATTLSAARHDVMSTLHAGVQGLRIAVPKALFWDDVDAEVNSAVRAAIDKLAALGASITEVAFDEAAEAVAANPRRIISSVEGCYAHEQVLGADFAGYDAALAHRVHEGRRASGIEYHRACEARKAIAARAASALADFDALVAPTTMMPTAPLDVVDATPEGYTEWNRLYARNTSVGNLLGLTALSVTCGFTEGGLPIGLMIHGKPCAEAMVLRIGQAYEASTEWHHRRPQLDWAGG